jgi:hypothetical protein
VASYLVDFLQFHGDQEWAGRDFFAMKIDQTLKPVLILIFQVKQKFLQSKTIQLIPFLFLSSRHFSQRDDSFLLASAKARTVRLQLKRCLLGI